MFNFPLKFQYKSYQNLNKCVSNRVSKITLKYLFKNYNVPGDTKLLSSVLLHDGLG